MKGIVLAAGYGTRLGELGKKLPKGLLPVKGKPVINYLLEQLSEIGIQEVLVVTNARFNKVFCAWLKEEAALYPQNAAVVSCVFCLR